MRNNLSATILGLLGLAMLPTCGASNDTPDVDAEKPSVTATGGQAISITHAKAISDLFVLEGSTLNMSMTAEQNAANVNSQALTSISVPCSGAAIHFDAASRTVSVDFGSSCNLPKLGKILGRVTAQVTKTDAPLRISVVFTFTGFSVNGRAIDGTWTVSTTDGKSLVVDCVLTSSQITLTLNAVTLKLDSDFLGVTVTGGGGINGPVVGTLDLTFDGIHQSFVNCYPNAGSIRFTKNLTIAGHVVATKESLTFDSNTPTTGKAQMLVGSIAATITLPAYGGFCPPSP